MGKAERTKQFIVERTAALFNTKGFAGTSLSDITEATGLTKGSIYGNFANKDEVALAVFDYNHQCLQKVFSNEIAKRATVLDKLLVYVEVYENYINHPFPTGGCPILNTATEADDTHPELKQKAQNAIMLWKNSIEKLIQTGIKMGELRSDIDAEKTALTIIATIEGATMIAKLTGKPAYRLQILSSVKKLIEKLK